MDGPRRFTHHKYRLPLSATFRNTRSSQMIGVEPLQAGIGSFHAMLSSGDQRTGRFVSPLVLFKFGPRHCGQFSAEAPLNETSKRANALTGFIIQKDTLNRDAPATHCVTQCYRRPRLL